MKNTTHNPLSKSLHGLIELLFGEQCSCVIRSGDTIRLFRERGIKDLYTLLRKEPDFLRGATIADKVVGKGAAALMVLGGVSELFADVISYPALELLARHRVRVSYTLAVEQILNRAKSGQCPVEQLCVACESPEECLPRIEEFLTTQQR